MPEKKTICCICGDALTPEEQSYNGCNPAPANNTPGARCCEQCDAAVVTPARYYMLKRYEEKKKGTGCSICNDPNCDNPGGKH